MGKKNRIRALAICVFRHHGCILVAEGYDSIKDQYFYRPLGGGIEFEEPSTETICRELMEELNVEVDRASLRYLGTIENIFYFNGKPGHEIVMIYDGAFKKHSLYDQTVILRKLADGTDIRVVWKNIQGFGEGKAILYPTGLLEMLREDQKTMDE